MSGDGLAPRRQSGPRPRRASNARRSSGVPTVYRSSVGYNNGSSVDDLEHSGVHGGVGLSAWSSFVPHAVLHHMELDLVGSKFEYDTPLPTRTFEAATLFADASGFTALTEKLAQRPNGAELMCSIMNRFIGAVIEIVHGHGGDVVKFAGDAVSVIFPIEGTAAVEAACR